MRSHSHNKILPFVKRSLQLNKRQVNQPQINCFFFWCRIMYMDNIWPQGKLIWPIKQNKKRCGGKQE